VQLYIHSLIHILGDVLNSVQKQLNLSLFNSRASSYSPIELSLLLHFQLQSEFLVPDFIRTRQRLQKLTQATDKRSWN